MVFNVKILLLWIYGWLCCLTPSAQSESNNDEFHPGPIMAIDILNSKLFWWFYVAALGMVILILICMKCHFFPKPGDVTKKSRAFLDDCEDCQVEAQAETWQHRVQECAFPTRENEDKNQHLV